MAYIGLFLFFVPAIVIVGISVGVAMGTFSDALIEGLLVLGMLVGVPVALSINSETDLVVDVWATAIAAWLIYAGSALLMGGLSDLGFGPLVPSGVPLSNLLGALFVAGWGLFVYGLAYRIVFTDDVHRIKRRLRRSGV